MRAKWPTSTTSARWPRPTAAPLHPARGALHGLRSAWHLARASWPGRVPCIRSHSHSNSHPHTHTTKLTLVGPSWGGGWSADPPNLAQEVAWRFHRICSLAPGREGGRRAPNDSRCCTWCWRLHGHRNHEAPAEGGGKRATTRSRPMERGRTSAQSVVSTVVSLQRNSIQVAARGSSSNPTDDMSAGPGFGTPSCSGSAFAEDTDVSGVLSMSQVPDNLGKKGRWRQRKVGKEMRLCVHIRALGAHDRVAASRGHPALLRRC